MLTVGRDRPERNVFGMVRSTMPAFGAGHKPGGQVTCDFRVDLACLLTTIASILGNGSKHDE
jgi:hypothetical protein